MTFIQQSIEEAKLTVEQEAKKIIINNKAIYKILNKKDFIKDNFHLIALAKLRSNQLIRMDIQYIYAFA